MRWLEKLFRILLWCLTGLMGIYIVYRGFLLGQEPGFVRDKLLPGFYEMLEQTAMEVLAPALLMEEKEGTHLLIKGYRRGAKDQYVAVHFNATVGNK